LGLPFSAYYQSWQEQRQSLHLATPEIECGWGQNFQDKKSRRSIDYGIFRARHIFADDAAATFDREQMTTLL
jgi:hypothetical protein